LLVPGLLLLVQLMVLFLLLLCAALPARLACTSWCSANRAFSMMLLPDGAQDST
jgi:hypothetical protein